MVETEKYGSVKRFGPRYGRTLKERFGKIETEQRKKQKCPYCSALKVKRIAIGIWGCKKCGAKFTGKAYSVSKKITFEEKTPEQEKEGTNIKEQKIKDFPTSKSDNFEKSKEEAKEVA